MLPKIILCSTCDILGRWTKEVTYNGKRLKAMKVENERNKWKAKSEFKNGRSEIQDFQYLAECIIENTVSFGILARWEQPFLLWERLQTRVVTILRYGCEAAVRPTHGTWAEG